MKKIIYYIFVCLVFCSCEDNTNLSQSSLAYSNPSEKKINSKQKFYYACDDKIYLETVEGKYIVTYSSKTSLNDKNVYQTKFSGSSIWMNDTISIVSIDNSKKIFFEEDLRKQANIKSVHPVYINSGCELGLTNEILVRFKDDIKEQNIRLLGDKYNFDLIRKDELYYVLGIKKEDDPLEVANSLQESGLVEFSHPNFVVQLNLHETISSDPYFKYQFSLHNTGQQLSNGKFGVAGADIKATLAWDITKGDYNIVVAVLDQGVSPDHPDLPRSRQLRSSNPDPTPYGDDNHGNACAGIIAASHNNEGIAGIAPNCRIMPYKILGSDMYTTNDIIVAAFNHARNMGADVISNSWSFRGGIQHPNFIPAINLAIFTATDNGRLGKGCVVTFSVGNTANHNNNDKGYIAYPANLPNWKMLRVGASDRYDKQANYSPSADLDNVTYYQQLDLVAPSHRAYSCQIPGETFEAWSLDIPGNNGYNPVKNTDCGSLPVIGSVMPNSGINNLAYTAHFGGTSYSCPQVAAVAALILSVKPNLSAYSVCNIIMSTARKAGSYNYTKVPGRENGTYSLEMGHGVLNAYEAVKKAAER